MYKLIVLTATLGVCFGDLNSNINSELDDLLSAPIITDDGGPLVLKLDSTSMNKNLKEYVAVLAEILIDEKMVNTKQELSVQIQGMKNVKAAKANGWETIFVACTGNGQSVYQTYLSSDNSTLEITSQDCSRKHLRSNVIDHWNGHMIDEVKLELFRGGKVEKVFVFDGTGSDKTNWFNKQRLVKSSYGDLSGYFTSNFFSIIGDTTVDRHFYINRNYGGCPNDKGWLMVVDTPDVNYRPCKFDKASEVDYPYIMYGPKNRRAHWEREGEYAVADKMVISIRTFGIPLLTK